MKNILLLGGVIPAVHLLRRLAKLVSSNSIHVIASIDDAIVYSKYGKKHLYNTPDNFNEVVNKWVIDNKSKAKDWLVIPCSEQFVSQLEVFRDKGFNVFAVDNCTLNLFYNKKKLYNMLEQLGVFVSQNYTVNDSLDFTNSKKYIVKPSVTENDFQPLFKTAVINNESEYSDLRNKLVNSGEKYIIQQLYENNENISYGGAWNDGIELASVVVKQERQYPQGVTSSVSLLEEGKDKELVLDVVNKISNCFKLQGFIELEFIKNESGLYPIDLNPRLWGWSNFLFYNYPQLVNHVSLSNSQSLISSNVKSWSNLWRDLPAILNGENSFIERNKLILSLFKSDKIDFLCLRDPKPEVYSLLKKII